MEFAPTADTVGKQYDVVATPEALAGLASALGAAGRFAFRVLPDGPTAMRAGIAGFAFSTGARHARYVPVARRTVEGGLFGDAEKRTGPASIRRPRWRRWRRCSKIRRCGRSVTT